jgi:uncharacterized surface protein with fasciclin (FAS1) repeats
MTEHENRNRNVVWIAAVLAMGLGPLAAFSIGQRYAGEETMTRAEAGHRSYEAPDRYADAYYGLPELEGAAGRTTVRDITADSALFEHYRDAVDRSGFGKVLEGPGPLTLFVPVDHAFAQLSESERNALFADSDRLVQMLSNQVVRGRLAATDLIQRDHVDTIGGRRVALEQGGHAVSFGDADIVKTDLVAGNGVVHIIDGLNL